MSENRNDDTSVYWFIRAVVLMAALLTPVPLAQQRPLPDMAPFLAEARKHLETDDVRQRPYMYVETRREQKLDKAQRPTGESIKVFESYPGLPGEQRWNRLIAEDGHPVPKGELEKKDRERQKQAEEYARRLQTDPEKERARQSREDEKDRREVREAIDDLFLVFNIRPLGRESIGGHDTIALELTPRTGAKPRTRAGRMMQKLNVHAWVSESDYELVRVDVETIDTVSFGLGLLARVHKGSRLSFQRRKVNGEVWLPERMTYTIGARLGLVATFRRGSISEFSDYKKFDVATTSTYSPPKRD